MTASYNIVPVIQNPEVNRGDSINVDFYISGAGETGRKRIHILHPYPELFQEDVGSIYPGMVLVPPEEVKENSNASSRIMARQDAPENHRKEGNVDFVGSQISVPDWILEEVPGSRVREISPPTPGPAPDTFPMKLSEGVMGETAPFHLELNIADDADPGEYEITSIFSYESASSIKSDKDTVVFHVNDWIEERQPTLTRVVILIALITLTLQGIDTLVPWIEQVI